MKVVFLLGLCLWATSVEGANWVTNPPFYGQKYTDIPTPRGLLLDDAGDILVVSTRGSNIIALYDRPSGEGVIVNQTVIISGTGLRLNHGIAFHDGYLYASSSTTVYRWPYVPGQRTLVTEPPETVVYNIPNFGHTTRTLAFDSASRLYVSVGSFVNVDSTSERARIRRFNFALEVPEEGFNFAEAEVFADGLRNEVGLAFDLGGTLWGVENGADMLNRPDLGGDIHNGNPAEELNRFDPSPAAPGAFYGYPYCFSTHNLTGYEPGTQFTWPSFMEDGIHTDDWCRNISNNRPPLMSMPAHTAPLGIQFYDGRGCGVSEGSFPCSATGDAFVAYHGSWNSVIPVGYRVGWLPFNRDTLEPSGDNIDVIFEPNTRTCIGRCFRPVNAIFDSNGHLIVSTDESNEIFRVYYNSEPPQIIT